MNVRDVFVKEVFAKNKMEHKNGNCKGQTGEPTSVKTKGKTSSATLPTIIPLINSKTQTLSIQKTN